MLLEMRVVCSERLSAALDALRFAAPSLPELAERVLDLLERGGGLVATTAFDGNDLAASGAGNARVLLEPTDALLELAAAARAVQFDVGVKHGGAS